MPDAPDPDSAAEPLRALFQEGLGELKLDATTGRPESLAQLAMLVASWAPRINLTGHRSLEAIAHRLVLDAVALTAALPEPPTSLVDIGSGAGFPGLPVAIVHEQCEVVLVEAKERKHHFQRAAVRQLALANVTCERGRVEDLVPQPAETVVAQAVGPAPRVLEWALPWVVDQGRLVIPGAEEPPQLGPDPRIEAVEIIHYRVPLGGPQRTLWIARCRNPDKSI